MHVGWLRRRQRTTRRHSVPRDLVRRSTAHELQLGAFKRFPTAGRQREISGCLMNTSVDGRRADETAADVLFVAHAADTEQGRRSEVSD